MITIRPRDARGHADRGWLDSHHTFSFADYHDPKHMGFRTLRVINEDRVQPGQGFGTHSHHDMEIISYVLEGTLEHKDSMGNGEQILPGEIQTMSAGTGVQHSEFNPSADEPVHFLQIWIIPDTDGLAPSYQKKPIRISAPDFQLKLLASKDGRDGSVVIHQDADLYLAAFVTGGTLNYQLKPKRHVWLQVARGQVALANQPLAAGDGAAVSGETAITVVASQPAEVLLFDLA